LCKCDKPKRVKSDDIYTSDDVDHTAKVYKQGHGGNIRVRMIMWTWSTMVVLCTDDDVDRIHDENFTYR
jgi:hypothetical protein